MVDAARLRKFHPLEFPKEKWLLLTVGYAERIFLGRPEDDEGTRE
jgi:hypothetical protein